MAIVKNYAGAYTSDIAAPNFNPRSGPAAPSDSAPHFSTLTPTQDSVPLPRSTRCVALR